MFVNTIFTPSLIVNILYFIPYITIYDILSRNLHRWHCKDIIFSNNCTLDF